MDFYNAISDEYLIISTVYDLITTRAGQVWTTDGAAVVSAQ